MNSHFHVRLLLRVFVGIALFAIAMFHAGLDSSGFIARSLLFGYVPDLGFLQIGLALLFFMLGVWLILGIRTRVIATFACVLCLYQIVMSAGAPTVHTGNLSLHEVAISTLLLASLLVLSAHGGGRTALVSRGWQGIINLR